jgi:MFS family permease
VDRLGGRRMSVIADLVSAVAIFAIPALYLTVGLEFWQLFLLVLLGALLDIPGYTARRTLLPGFSKRANVRPEAINSAFEMMQAISGVLGPAVAGLLIAPLGAVNLLWVTGAGFLLSALTVYGVVPSTVLREEPELRRLSYRQQITEGLAFIGRDRLLLALAVVFGATNFVNNGFYGVGLPVAVFEQFGDASHFGLILSVTSVGTLVGGTFYGAVGHRLRSHRRTLVLIGFMVQPVFLLPYALQAPFAVLVVSSFLSGLAIGPVNPLSVTVRFERIPPRLHGRVFATFSAISGVVTPVGMAMAGWIFEAFGTQASLAIITIVAALIVLPLPAIRPFHEMNVKVDDEAKVPLT